MTAGPGPATGPDPGPGGELTAVAAWLADGHPALVGRVVGIEGFSTWPGDQLIAVDPTGERRGAILGPPGTDALARRAAEMYAAGEAGGLQTTRVSIQGSAVAAAGLSCGGAADVLLQPSESIPATLWAAVAARAPVALVTRIEGPTAGPASMVVTGDGRWSGTIDVGDPDALALEAVALIAGGHSTTRRVEDGAGIVLIEGWVPAPRLVVVGGGEDLCGALDRQGALLGWETRVTPDLEAVDAGLDWAGASAAMIVLSHDPHLDVAALRTGLVRNAAYLGALGSRRTQSRRVERLVAEGVTDAELARIHRPIGLDLGGRSPAEVALAIAAEILAVRCGRDARPLAERQAPINSDRPAS